ncbi:unnamed protein product [Lampetra fluviatilis]
MCTHALCLLMRQWQQGDNRCGAPRVPQSCACVPYALLPCRVFSLEQQMVPFNGVSAPRSEWLLLRVVEERPCAGKG